MTNRIAGTRVVATQGDSQIEGVLNSDWEDAAGARADLTILVGHDPITINSNSWKLEWPVSIPTVSGYYRVTTADGARSGKELLPNGHWVGGAPDRAGNTFEILTPVPDVDVLASAIRLGCDRHMTEDRIASEIVKAMVRNS